MSGFVSYVTSEYVNVVTGCEVSGAYVWAVGRDVMMTVLLLNGGKDYCYCCCYCYCYC